MPSVSGLAFAVAVSLFVLPVPAGLAQQEAAISEDDFKKLDTFEGLALSKADKVFTKKEYRQAAAEYDTFILDFPKSPAQAYAVYRKARSIQLDNKRFEAIKAYNEVLDYFPNAVSYAAAALYYIGECHWQNGDVKEAMKAWAELAADTDYRKHPLAASAINKLADSLVQQGKANEAAAYYKQVAVDFRGANPEASRYAMNIVIYHYVRRQPDEAKLKEFYDKVQTFEGNPSKPSDDNYWFRVREAVRGNGNFQESEKDKRADYFRYWAKTMEGKRADDDDFQIDLAAFRLWADGSVDKWIAALDQQFASRQKEGDYGRVVKWISLFRAQKNKVQEYYSKLDFAKMNNAQIQALMRVLFDEVQNPEMAKNVFEKIKLDALNDNEKYALERYLWNKDGWYVALVCQTMTDKDMGRMELLAYYHWARNFAKGIPLADEVAGIPKYSKDAYWKKAEMLQWQNKFQEAIGAYQSADNPPDNLWRITDCFLGMGKREQALAQLQEIENFFPNQASAAALRTAYVWRDAKENKQYIACLRGIMKKYPKSGQSTTAHQELERMGVKIGGGVDAE
jgi:TolA-binding protein